MAKAFKVRWILNDNTVINSTAFLRARDAARWLEDNPRPGAVIVPAYHKGGVVTWGSDCPKCNTRAKRDKANMPANTQTNDGRVLWTCPKCKHSYLD